MHDPALLIVDVQKGLADPRQGVRNNPDAELNIARLLAYWRQHNLPIIHVQHCSLEPHSLLRPEMPGHEIQDAVRPLDGEQLFKKTVHSAFIGTGLQDYLHQQGIQSLVVVGLTTDHCVSTTTRMAADLGFKVTLVADATAAFERAGRNGTYYTGEDIHTINLVSLDREFCRVTDTELVLSELQQ